MTDDPYRLRPISEGEWEPFLRCFLTAFGQDYREEESRLERAQVELDRTLAAFDERDGLVGTCLSVRRELTVPGGVLPAAHVTLVSVHPTHRRRGLASRLMRRQLTELRATDEPVALLWASEDTIYGRYGYGPAVQTFQYDADTRELSLTPPPAPGRLRETTLVDGRKDVAAVYEATRRNRPGLSSRSDAVWDAILADPEHERDGHSTKRLVLHEKDGMADGYALFRIGHDWTFSGPSNPVQVLELAAADLGAYTELWRYLMSLDLTRRIRYPFAAADEPIQYLVDSPKRLGAVPRGGQWVRILDVPAALAARRYAAPVDLVLELTDRVLPENARRWRLTAGPDAATCVPDDGPADLALDVAELSAAYLGGTSLAALGHGGRVRELRPGALAEAGAAFGWHRAPIGIEIF